MSARVPGDKGPTRVGALRVHAGPVWGGSLSLLSLGGQAKKQLPQAGEGSRCGRGMRDMALERESSYCQAMACWQRP